MYDLLLKWGLESLSNATMKKSDQDVAVMLEAIKARNVLVVERFKYSRETSQSIISLTVDVEEALENLVESLKEFEWGTRKGKEGILWNITKFHAGHARKLKKLRCGYNSTNDLFAAYSTVFSDLLNMNTIEDIANNRNIIKRSEFLWIYRGLWQFYSGIMSALIRITSSDLRFWLTDEPYITQAFNCAENDFKRAKEWLCLNPGHGDRFYLSLEKPEGLAEFWNRVNHK